MELRLRGDVQPTDMFDDATVLLYRCYMLSHSAALMLVQTERRGSMDDETIETLTIPIAEYQLQRLRELGDACPDRTKYDCTCLWHTECSAANVITNRATFEKKPDEPYSWEDEQEKNMYQYGRSN
jgi:hypothetical protein